ncbi:hypothetical protein PtA15_15A38 [Puccinia triticina]|uniref:SAM domain-containing protein n=1 Tax=Puccinia triticina TaxID=208348 RepID=A0ABY7D224_9BASI|nr:uncharacterized protein PtA15_15A38 [Puccinia triticina]WAQ91649.1 hypothetical protein PtA15_15A38 [Puccinia triticina]WAR62448.1 hypothetical protein PtB15_15B32 [Puccinia triticina]
MSHFHPYNRSYLQVSAPLSEIYLPSENEHLMASRPNFHQPDSHIYPSNFHMPPALGLLQLPNDVVPLPPPAQVGLPHIPSCSILPVAPHIFTCDISFVVYCSRKNKQNQPVWNSIQSPKEGHWITIDTRTITYDLFHQLVAAKCAKNYAKLPSLLHKGTTTIPPYIHWSGYIICNKQWPKGRPKPISTRSDFAAWIDAITKARTPATKGGVSIKMADPAVEIALAANNDLLVESVRRSEAWEAAMAAQQSQGSLLGLHPLDLMDDDSDGDSCNEDFKARTIIKVDLFNKYKQNTGVVSSHPIYPDPTDVNRYIILTPGNVALWAKAIHLKEPGVGLLSPPATLKYYNRKTKKSLLLDASPGAPGPQLGSSDLVASLVEACRATIRSNATNLNLVQSPPSLDAGSLEGDPPLLIEYLKFAGVLPTEKTLAILAGKDIDSYQMFADGYMSNEDLKGLGLTKGTLAKLRNNVGPY